MVLPVLLIGAGLKSLERNILRFSGIGRISETLIGSVEAINDAGRKKWLTKVQLLGSAIMRRLSKARFMLRMKRATRSYLSCSFDVNLLNLRRGGLKYRNFQYTL
jgi:hypothetical protein